MAEQFLYDLHVHARGEGQSGATAPKIVQPDGGRPLRRTSRSKWPESQVLGWLQRRMEPPGEMGPRYGDAQADQACE